MAAAGLASCSRHHDGRVACARLGGLRSGAWSLALGRIARTGRRLALERNRGAGGCAQVSAGRVSGMPHSSHSAPTNVGVELTRFALLASMLFALLLRSSWPPGFRCPRTLKVRLLTSCALEFKTSLSTHGGRPLRSGSRDSLGSRVLLFIVCLLPPKRWWTDIFQLQPSVHVLVFSGCVAMLLCPLFVAFR